MNRKEIELGDKVQDIISGVTGIVVEKTTRIFSDTKFKVVEDTFFDEPPKLKEYIFEKKRLVVISSNELWRKYENPPSNIRDDGTF